MQKPDFDPIYDELTPFLSEDVARRATELWSTYAPQPGTVEEVRRSRTEGYQKLQKILATYQGLPQNLDSTDLGEVQEEILLRLGLWFSSYFLGFPLPH